MRYLYKILLGIVLISLAFLVWPESTITDETDTKKEQTLQGEIEHSLVAPCCWNMTVDNHESGASHEVRNKIGVMIKQGKTRDEILQVFVEQYGERILASPSQNNLLGKLAYWLIPLAIVLGIFVVGKTLARLSYSNDKNQIKQPKSSQEQSKDSYLDRRVEEELKRIE